MSIYANQKLWNRYDYSFLIIISEAIKELAENIIKYFEKDEKISPEAMEEAKAILQAKTW